MTEIPRPLSPHLSVYQWQLTSVLSILHRVTGIVLSLGTILLAYWLIAIARGPVAFDQAQAIVGSWPALTLLFGWTLTLFYHLFNGIRHLVWDAGYGLDLPNVYRSGYTVVIASVVVTLIVWVIGLTSGPSFE